MDTRFWGPSGWNLLHSIASNYPNKPSLIEKQKYQIFFQSLPIILPCIYCRRSLTEYYQENPLTNECIKNKDSLSTWLYKIHNLVNDKLRNQGLNDKIDPDIKLVLKKFRKPNCCTIKKCKNFLYSIAMNYPQNDKCITLNVRENYHIFFSYLANIYPNHKISKKLTLFNKKYPVHKYLKNRETLFKWVYMWEKIINEKCPCVDNRIKETSKYIAGCKGIGDEKPTCRVTK